MNILILSLLLLTIISASAIDGWTNLFSAKAFANYAILPAEHNINYGILQRYRNTTPEQACINTISHCLRDFEVKGGGTEAEFISFLGSRYAPIGSKNDPNNLNNNWIKNVTYFWDKYKKIHK